METNYSKGNKSLKIILGFVAILFVILFFKGCFDKKGEMVTVYTKPSKVITQIGKPEIIVLHDTVFIEKYFPKDISKKDKEFYKSETKRLLSEYDSLDLAFRSSNDSLQQIIYQKTILPKAFTKTWENDTLKSTVFGILSGTIHSMQLKTDIKSRKETIKIPKTVFRLISGIEIGATKDLSKTNFKANVGFQNKSGSIISASIDSDERIYIGYSFSVFSIKR